MAVLRGILLVFSLQNLGTVLLIRPTFLRSDFVLRSVRFKCLACYLSPAFHERVGALSHRVHLTLADIPLGVIKTFAKSAALEAVIVLSLLEGRTLAACDWNEQLCLDNLMIIDHGYMGRRGRRGGSPICNVELTRSAVPVSRWIRRVDAQ